MCRGGRGGGRSRFTPSPREGTRRVAVQCLLPGLKRARCCPSWGEGCKSPQHPNQENGPSRSQKPWAPSRSQRCSRSSQRQGDTQVWLLGKTLGTGGAGMLLVPWAVGEWGKGLTEGQHIWGHGLVSQPSQGSSSLLQSPSGPSSRSSEGPRAGASPQPATPWVQVKPLLPPRGARG